MGHVTHVKITISDTHTQYRTVRSLPKEIGKDNSNGGGGDEDEAQNI